MTKSAGPATTFVVVRAWREPDGPLCARVGAVTDAEHGTTHWEPCLGIEQTLAAVRTRLQRWSLDSPDSPHH